MLPTRTPTHLAGRLQRPQCGGNVCHAQALCVHARQQLCQLMVVQRGQGRAQRPHASVVTAAAAQPHKRLLRGGQGAALGWARRRPARRGLAVLGQQLLGEEALAGRVLWWRWRQRLARVVWEGGVLFQGRGGAGREAAGVRRVTLGTSLPVAA